MKKLYYFRHLPVLLLVSLLFACGSAKRRGGGSEQTTASTKAEEAKAEASGEVVNRVRYIVGDVAVTEMDIAEMNKNLPLLQRAGAVTSKKATAVEELIRRAIVDMEAKRESLLVTDTRIENEISRRKDAAGVTSDEAFQKLVEKQAGMPYTLWLEDMPYQILKRQLIQLRVEVPPPTTEDMEKFYRQNRDKVGMEVAWREIVFRPRSNSDELRVSKMAGDLWRKLNRNPNLFPGTAKKHPENASRYAGAGGYHGYVPLHELARNNNRLAGVLFQLRPGQLAPLFVENGRYYIIMLTSRRPTPFNKVRNLIRGRVMLEKEEQAFDDWIEKMKKEIAIVEVK